MPTGYLVSLGNGSLDVGDSITATPSDFTIGRSIGTGEWTWTGVWENNGQTYSNITDTGVYYTDTNGDVYFIPDNWFTTSGTATVTTAPPYTPDGTIDGTTGNDLIDTTFSDVDNEGVSTGDDIVIAGDGNDTIVAGRGEDSIYAGTGADEAFGGEGNDFIDTDTGSDVAYGGQGDDSIVAGNGVDTFYGGTGNDTMDAGNTGDFVYGGAGNDTITDSGGSGSTDTIFGGAGDDSIDAGLGDDVVIGGDGDDTIDGGNGADSIQGGAGSDSIEGGDGDDVLIGDSNTTGAASSENLSWTGFGPTGTPTHGAVTQDTGSMTVSVEITDDGTSTGMDISDSTQFVGTGPFATNSALRLTGGEGPTSTTVITFEANLDSGLTDAAENVEFRINDIDTSGWQDIVTVNAYDADGNVVTVVLTPEVQGTATSDTVSGNTITAGNESNTPEDAEGSVLVQIAGPVHSIEIIYENGSTAGQALWVTDVHFDTVVSDTSDHGDDTISGGAGADVIEGNSGDDTVIGGTGEDTLYGGAGQDEFVFSEGDSAYGGDGDDLFVLEDLGETSNGSITIDGGSGNETDGDTLQLGTLAVLTQDVINTFVDDGTGSLSGTVTLDDGTLLTFSEIENVICFTPDTKIATPRGLMAVKDLQVGDMVVTRDHGLQAIRWVEARTVPAHGRFAPIRISKGVLAGQESDLVVSPQHRVLFQGYHAELLFGESEVLVAAKHLVDGQRVTQAESETVHYVHMLFDQHEVIYAQGAATESFHPGDIGFSAVSDPAREELFGIFPELRADQSAYGNTARRCLKAHEAKLIHL